MKAYGYLRWEVWIISIVHLSAYMSIFYWLRQLIIPRYFEQGKWLFFITGTLVLTSFTVVMWYYLLLAICPIVQVYSSTIPGSPTEFILEAIQMFVPGLILLTWEIFEKQAIEAKRLHEVEKGHLDTELSLLKAQINPQFLLSSLHHIREQIKKNTPQSGDLILKLSAVLDYVLYTSKKGRVPLIDEIEVIENYINLEEERIQSSNRLILKHNSANENVTIAPLTLFSIIEKLQIQPNNQVENIQINISSRLDHLLCQIQSKTHSFLTQEDQDSIKRQLELTYPSQHYFTLNEHKGQFIATLTIPYSDEK